MAASRSVRLPLRDRLAAGALLAEALRVLDLGPDAIVLGIPRGGVPVAAAVAERLDLDLDVIVAHKLGAPGNPEFAIGAVTSDGTRIIEPWAAGQPWLTDTYVAAETERQLGAARERARRLRGHEADGAPMAGRTVIIVDDGIATGATAHVAAVAARAAGARRIVIAAPIGAPDSTEALRPVADDIVTLATPEPFFAVGEWYERFEQVTDEEIEELLRTARLRMATN